MIVSHRHEFIFVKTAKTAGTAIEVSLSPLCGPDDVVTPIIPPEPGHEPRNFRREGGDFYAHMPASEIRQAVGRACFDRYTTFCVERHPVSKCISQYAMRQNSPHHVSEKSRLTWEEYVELGSFPVATSRYTDEDGELLVDRILPYERLAEALAELFLELGVPWNGLTSRAKSGFRKGVIREDQVTPEQRRTIMEAFRSSSRFTGYT